jgi:hypothetical protein
MAHHGRCSGGRRVETPRTAPRLTATPGPDTRHQYPNLIGRVLPAAAREGLTAEDIAARTGAALRRVQRQIARWREGKAPGPRIWDEPTSRGGTRAMVDAAEWAAIQRGEFSAEPV